MRITHPRTTALLAIGVLAAVGACSSLARHAFAGAPAPTKESLTRGFKTGEWDYKSIGPLAFSPSGVLFFADDQAGAVYGVALDEKPSTAAPFSKVPDLGATLAARLGTTPTGIQVKDVALSPVSNQLYVSVRKTDGGNQNAADPANYALFAVDSSGKVTAVDLSKRPFAKVAIGGKVGYGQREGSPKIISDITCGRDRILVAALSSEQFDSNLVSLPLPLRDGGVERFATSIYHVSHKRQETASPIQTLTIYRDGDKEYLMGAYVCTPVVRFNLEDLKPGQVVKGITVAELGSGNRPMDMIAYGAPGQQSLLVNNSSFGVMKVGASVAREQTAVNEATTADRGRGGQTPKPGLEVVEGLKGASGYVATNQGTLLVLKPGQGSLALEPMPLP